MLFITETVLLVLASAFLLYLYVKRNRQYWKKRNIPFIETTSIWGNIENPLTIKKGLNTTIQKAYDEFKRKGHIHGGIHVFLDPTYMPIEPELVKNVLTKDFASFAAHGHIIDAKNDPLSANLFSLDGDDWKDMRVKFTPTFTSGKMKMMFSTLLECAGPMMGHIDESAKSGKALNTKDVVSAFTMDVIASCAFGVESNSFKNPDTEFRKHGLRILYPSFREALSALTNIFIPSIGKWTHLRLTARDTESFFINLVKSIVGYRDSNNFKRNDFIQLFIELNRKAKANGETPLTINQIAAQCFIFFVAGFETSATTMTFCLHELAYNQDVQDKLRQEIRETMSNHDGKLNYDGIMEMKYMDKVIKETLRKYPPVGIIGRECTKDYKVPNTDAIIEEGTRIFISVLGLHRDEEYYPDSNKFDPERFTEEHKAKRHPYTYLPFGEGPRICIGLRFGVMQAKTGLALILRKFKVLPVEGESYDMEYDPKTFVLAKKGSVLLNALKLDS